jgi:ATP-dependent DNA helicase RecQ
MFWQKRDAALLAHFAHAIEDPAEKKRAWQRYDEIRGFVESANCRHRQICAHFGENPKWNSCAACDVCSGEPEYLAETPVAERDKKRKPHGSGRAQAAESGVDAELREYLREWRRKTAKEREVPAYVVMHDTALDELCRVRPKSLAGVRQVPGFGDRKTELYGPGILEALTRFSQGEHATAAPETISKPAEETVRLLGEGRTLAEIAEIRGRQMATVVSMVAELVEQGQIEFQASWVADDRRIKIEEAGGRLGLKRLRALKDALPAEVTFEDIRLVTAKLRRKQSGVPALSDR